jgi:hypothetical protein
MEGKNTMTQKCYFEEFTKPLTGVNFINILRAAFYHESFVRSFFELAFLV